MVAALAANNPQEEEEEEESRPRAQQCTGRAFISSKPVLSEGFYRV